MALFGKKTIIKELGAAYTKYKNNNYEQEIILKNRFTDLPVENVNVFDKIGRIGSVDMNTAFNVGFERAANRALGGEHLSRAGNSFSDAMDSLDDWLSGKKNDGVVQLRNRPYCAYRMIMKLGGRTYDEAKGEGQFNIYNIDGYKVFDISCTRTPITGTHTFYLTTNTEVAGNVKQTNGGLLSKKEITISSYNNKIGTVRQKWGKPEVNFHHWDMKIKGDGCYLLNCGGSVEVAVEKLKDQPDVYVIEFSAVKYIVEGTMLVLAAYLYQSFICS